MQQETQQYTAAQILEAGQEAEADGRITHALRFYDHLAGNYGWAPEAVAARAALVRLRDQPTQAPLEISGPNGTDAPPSLPDAGMIFANGSPAPRRRITVAPMDVASRVPLVLPQPDASYRFGGLIAGLVLLAGVGSMLSGAALLLVPAWMVRFSHFLPTTQSVDSSAAAAGLMAGGLVLVLAGELFRAVLAQARATRELVAIARARAQYEAAEVDKLRVGE